MFSKFHVTRNIEIKTVGLRGQRWCHCVRTWIGRPPAQEDRFSFGPLGGWLMQILPVRQTHPYMNKHQPYQRYMYSFYTKFRTEFGDWLLWMKLHKNIPPHSNHRPTQEQDILQGLVCSLNFSTGELSLHSNQTNYLPMHVHVYLENNQTSHWKEIQFFTTCNLQHTWTTNVTEFKLKKIENELRLRWENLQ